MIIDGENYTQNALVGPEPVVIVGTGPSALALRAGLRRRMIPVVLLERGTKSASSKSTFNNFEQVGRPFSGVAKRGVGLGGSGELWAGQCLRFSAIDFEKRAWIPDSGWPFTIDDLWPFYAEAEQFMDVSADEYSDAHLRRFGLEPSNLSDAELSLRFSVYAPAPAIYSRSHKLISADPGTCAIFNAEVVDVECRDNAISSVTFRTPSGKQHQVRGREYVFAAGTIENARLLLTPRMTLPQGVGNEYGHVGRHLMDHPNGVIGSIRADGTAMAAEHLVKWFSLYYKSGRRYLPRLVVSRKSQEDNQVLNACVYPVYSWPHESMNAALRELQKAVSGARNENSYYKTAFSLLKQPRALIRFTQSRASGRPFVETPSRIMAHVQLEQSPATESRVTLSAKRDVAGNPLASIDWRIGDLEARTIEFLGAAFDKYLTRMRFGGLEKAPTERVLEGLIDNQHQAGTTRMATSNSLGVVDSDCRVFGLQNLYMGGGSVFPTNSFANSTLTMMAMSFKLASHLGLKRRHF